mgnify:FL=1
MKDLAQDKEMLIASNKSLAEYNLKLQPRINQGREYLAIQYEKASKLKEEYDTLRSVLGRLYMYLPPPMYKTTVVDMS